METGFETGPPNTRTEGGDGTRILLFMDDDDHRDVLRSMLDDRYDVDVTREVADLDRTIDCGIVDATGLAQVRGALGGEGCAAFRPIVLLQHDDDGSPPPGSWEYVDEVIDLPVRDHVIRTRIENLIERRHLAVELDEVVEELRLKERAMDKAPIGMTITDPTREDNPLVYLNRAFTELTGYDHGSIGRNMRILQGEDTDPATRRSIKRAIGNGEPISTDIVNYSLDGKRFWNSLDIAPVRDETGELTNFVGFQTDITDRKIKERRLEVLNRVLAHNLRNKMNVIEGHLALLREDLPDERPSAVEPIDSAASDLRRLADKVQDIERILSDPEGEHAYEFDASIAQLLSVFRDRYPQASFTYRGPDQSPIEIAGHGLMTAIREAVENAVKHNEHEESTVEIDITADGEGWCHIEISDNGPPIPRHEIDVLRQGETPLQHADRLGIWLMYWVVSKAGGRFTVDPGEDRGNTISFDVPVDDET